MNKQALHEAKMIKSQIEMFKKMKIIEEIITK